VTNQPLIVDDNLNRRYFTLQSQLTGPVFNRIWDTPGNGYAEKFKHTIEPLVTIQRISFVNNYDRIIKSSGSDFTSGGSTQITYGVANRFYAKRKATPGGPPAQAREILTVEVRQTHSSTRLAAQYDTQCSSCNGTPATSNFSPLSLSVRAQPTTALNATVNADFDSRYRTLRTVTASGSYTWNTQLQSTLSWTKTGCIAQVNDCTILNNRSQSLNGSSTVRTKDNQYGAIYSFNYDVVGSTMRNQQISGFYNAQCCGISFQFQNTHFGTATGVLIPSDHRFFMSFTLAGLGNFSPFNGALGGVPR
jgi:hypothetical protein